MSSKKRKCSLLASGFLILLLTACQPESGALKVSVEGASTSLFEVVVENNGAFGEFQLNSGDQFFKIILRNLDENKIRNITASKIKSSSFRWRADTNGKSSYPGFGGSCASTLEALSECSIIVAYSPTRRGESKEQITFSALSIIGKVERVINIQAVAGDNAVLDIEKSSVNFGFFDRSGTKQKVFDEVVQLKNVGGFKLRELNFSIVDDIDDGQVFSFVSYCPLNLEIGEECSLRVLFQGSSFGELGDDDIPFSARVKMAYRPYLGAGESLQFINLSVKGTDQYSSLELTKKTYDFSAKPHLSGLKEWYPITISNSGNFMGQVDSLEIVGKSRCDTVGEIKCTGEYSDAIYFEDPNSCLRNIPIVGSCSFYLVLDFKAKQGDLLGDLADKLKFTYFNTLSQQEGEVPLNYAILKTGELVPNGLGRDVDGELFFPLSEVSLPDYAESYITYQKYRFSFKNSGSSKVTLSSMQLSSNGDGVGAVRERDESTCTAGRILLQGDTCTLVFDVFYPGNVLNGENLIVTAKLDYKGKESVLDDSIVTTASFNADELLSTLVFGDGSNDYPYSSSSAVVFPELWLASGVAELDVFVTNRGEIARSFDTPSVLINGLIVYNFNFIGDGTDGTCDRSLSIGPGETCKFKIENRFHPVATSLNPSVFLEDALNLEYQRDDARPACSFSLLGSGYNCMESRENLDFGFGFLDLKIESLKAPKSILLKDVTPSYDSYIYRKEYVSTKFRAVQTDGALDLGATYPNDIALEGNCPVDATYCVYVSSSAFSFTLEGFGNEGWEGLVTSLSGATFKEENGVMIVSGNAFNTNPQKRFFANYTGDYTSNVMTELAHFHYSYERKNSISGATSETIFKKIYFLGIPDKLNRDDQCTASIGSHELISFSELNDADRVEVLTISGVPVEIDWGVVSPNCGTVQNIYLQDLALLGSSLKTSSSSIVLKGADPALSFSVPDGSSYPAYNTHLKVEFKNSNDAILEKYLPLRFKVVGESELIECAITFCLPASLSTPLSGSQVAFPIEASGNGIILQSNGMTALTIPLVLSDVLMDVLSGVAEVTNISLLVDETVYDLASSSVSHTQLDASDRDFDVNVTLDILDLSGELNEVNRLLSNSRGFFSIKLRINDSKDIIVPFYFNNGSGLIYESAPVTLVPAPLKLTTSNGTLTFNSLASFSGHDSLKIYWSKSLNDLEIDQYHAFDESVVSTSYVENEVVSIPDIFSPGDIAYGVVVPVKDGVVAKLGNPRILFEFMTPYSSLKYINDDGDRFIVNLSNTTEYLSFALAKSACLANAINIKWGVIESTINFRLVNESDLLNDYITETLNPYINYWIDSYSINPQTNSSYFESANKVSLGGCSSSGGCVGNALIVRPGDDIDILFEELDESGLFYNSGNMVYVYDENNSAGLGINRCIYAFP